MEMLRRDGHESELMPRTGIVFSVWEGWVSGLLPVRTCTYGQREMADRNAGFMNETGLVLYVYHQEEEVNGEETCLTVRNVPIDQTPDNF